MNLKQILGHIENHEELINQIEAELGKNFVPRSEFNEKNEGLKTLQTQLDKMTTDYNNLTTEKSTLEQTLAGLNEKVSGYEKAAIRAKVAHEVGLPYELATRLSGDDEKAIREDAKLLAGLVKNNQPLPPLKDNEGGGGNDENAAYKSLLSNLKGE